MLIHLKKRTYTPTHTPTHLSGLHLAREVVTLGLREGGSLLVGVQRAESIPGAPGPVLVHGQDGRVLGHGRPPAAHGHEVLGNEIHIYVHTPR